MTNINDFINYCCDFYDVARPDAIYPFASTGEIVAAAAAHVANPTPAFPFDGDSTDREAVRDLILDMRRLLGIGITDFDLAILQFEATRQVATFA